MTGLVGGDLGLARLGLARPGGVVVGGGRRRRRLLLRREAEVGLGAGLEVELFGGAGGALAVVTGEGGVDRAGARVEVDQPAGAGLAGQGAGADGDAAGERAAHADLGEAGLELLEGLGGELEGGIVVGVAGERLGGEGGRARALAGLGAGADGLAQRLGAGDRRVGRLEVHGGAVVVLGLERRDAGVELLGGGAQLGGVRGLGAVRRRRAAARKLAESATARVRRRIDAGSFLLGMGESNGTNADGAG